MDLNIYIIYKQIQKLFLRNIVFQVFGANVCTVTSLYLVYLLRSLFQGFCVYLSLCVSMLQISFYILVSHDELIFIKKDCICMICFWLKNNLYSANRSMSFVSWVLIGLWSTISYLVRHFACPHSFNIWSDQIVCKYVGKGKIGE